MSEFVIVENPLRLLLFIRVASAQILRRQLDGTAKASSDHKRNKIRQRRLAVYVCISAILRRTRRLDNLTFHKNPRPNESGNSVLPRSQQLRRVPHDRLSSMLENRERLGDFGNRLFRAFSIDDDNVGWAADGKAIVGKIEQPR
jgi:hypothetical protein